MTLSLMSLHHLISGSSRDAGWGFTYDEIRHQLAYLGVTNLSDSKLYQVKNQLDDLIAKEWEQAQVTSELSRCCIDDLSPSHLGSVPNFSSDSRECSSPEPGAQKSLSDLDSHCTALTNFSNRKMQSTKPFFKSHAHVKPCRSVKAGYLSHVLHSDVRTESGDIVSTISDINDSPSVVTSASVQSADDAFSTRAESFFRDRYLENPSLFPDTGDSHFARSHHESQECLRSDGTPMHIVTVSTPGHQNTRIMQCEGPLTAHLGSTTSCTQSTFSHIQAPHFAWDVSNSQSSSRARLALERRPSPVSGGMGLQSKGKRFQKKPLSTKPSVTPTIVTEGCSNSNSPFRSSRLPNPRIANLPYGLAVGPKRTLPDSGSGPNSSHLRSHRSELRIPRGSQRSPLYQRATALSAVTAAKLPQNNYPEASITEPVSSATGSAPFTDRLVEKIYDAPPRSADHIRSLRPTQCAETKRPTSATASQHRPHIERLVRRKDPVSRFQSYQRIWLTHLVPGEDARRVLRWNIKTAMMHREVPLLQRNLAEISHLFGRNAVAFLERERARHLKSLQPIMLPTASRRHPKDRPLALR